MSSDRFLDAVWAWDPIGIGDERDQAPTEYDELASRVRAAADAGGVDAAEEVARTYLRELGIHPAGLDAFLAEIGRLVADATGSAPLAGTRAPSSVETFWLAALPEDLRSRARSLRAQHIYEDAFLVPDALEVLSFLEQEHLVVLGGDFWREAEAQRLRPTYENWDLTSEPESPHEESARSIAESRARLSSHQPRTDWVVLTCRPAGATTAPTDRRIVFRPRFGRRWLATVLAVTGLLAAIALWTLPALAGAALMAAVAYRQARVSMTADGEGLVVRNFLGTRRLAWSEIAAFVGKDSDLLVTTCSNDLVVLQAVDVHGGNAEARQRHLAAIVADLSALRPG